MPEEIHNITSDTSLLLIPNKSFVNKNVEIIPNLFSKTSGFLNIEEKQNVIKEISIKSGLIYKVEDLKSNDADDHALT